YIVKNQIKSLSDLKKFDVDGYKFSKEDSEKNLLVFKR
ncbi:hypothetical protein M901_1623, partial [Bacteriovorax sp. DB6_IX]